MLINPLGKTIISGVLLFIFIRWMANEYQKAKIIYDGILATFKFVSQSQSLRRYFLIGFRAPFIFFIVAKKFAWKYNKVPYIMA